ncbi:MAG: DUF4390 domain-containing protein [Brachymonas sp.]|nr:DUF4390 domain-containing protein [Brachymonas sp.]NJS35889.1 DUF4390 domain-containing protein [Brachymonas sp.]
MPAAWSQNAVELPNLRVEQNADGLYLSASLNFELTAAVEAALLKGIPMNFVAEAQVFRDRWYWYDKNVSVATRTVRLAYQPLTRRWRVNVSSVAAEEVGAASLSQNFEQLQDAMGVVRRIARWKIADGNEVDVDSRHNVEFRFRLDTTALPRPMQIGITGNSEWNLSVQRRVRPER